MPLPSLPEPNSRHVVLFLFGVIVVQLLYYFRDPIQTSLDRPYFVSNPSKPKTNTQHPSVPLNLHGLSVLDELAAHIVTVEAHRTFAESGLVDIHGSTIQNSPTVAKRIRDQIHCWTQHGSWVRQDEKNDKGAPTSWSARKALGDSQFNVCDARFIKGLNQRPADGYKLGDYDQKNGRWIVREAVKYRWVPDESVCGPATPLTDGNTKEDPTAKTQTTGLGDERSVYQPFDANKFCEILASRNMLVAGDTTQYQLYNSILSAMGSSFTCTGEQECHPYDPRQLCATSNIMFSRNDFISAPSALGTPDSNKEYPKGHTIEQSWATLDILPKYRVVLLNKGLVWKPDNEFLAELVFSMKHLWKFYPDHTILYRATHPPSDCATLKDKREDEAIAGDNGESIVPGATIQRPLTEPPSRTRDSSDPEQWHRPTLADIQRQNMMAKGIVESAGGIFLDTEYMFALRPDGRMGDGDCSRFCAPGPLDAYTDLLYNTLRILPPMPENRMTEVPPPPL
ncbi:hypothetical protein B0O80DRAFT_460442 [Mortierella sp. GBAus27b]|nr:hypothetical protein BGX31_008626 [Mortierella sp. GBA43]KAI8349325.1 hypothetical protein B0O80DRAFT_460442 [Mortierella sp. GBAus27b]